MGCQSVVCRAARWQLGVLEVFRVVGKLIDSAHALLQRQGKILTVARHHEEIVYEDKLLVLILMRQ